MGAPEKIDRRGNGFARSGSLHRFRRHAEKILANPPKPRKGYSVVRELAELRLRGGKLR